MIWAMQIQNESPRDGGVEENKEHAFYSYL